MPCSSAANLLISRVRCEASSVADCCGVNAVDLPEFMLGAPEAAETKDSGARTLGKWWLKDRVQHGVLLGNGESRLLTAGKGLGGHHHLGLVATKEHCFASSDILMYWITVLAEICFRAKPIMASPIVREPGFDLVSHSRSGPLFALRLSPAFACAWGFHKSRVRRSACVLPRTCRKQA